MAVAAAAIAEITATIATVIMKQGMVFVATLAARNTTITHSPAVPCPQATIAKAIGLRILAALSNKHAVELVLVIGSGQLEALC